MNYGVCIGVLDEKIGPSPIYSLHLDSELAKKIVLKVMVGVMAFSSETDENSLRGESIIPFLKERIITFAYLFPIKDVKARGGFRQCSLILIFNINQRKSLYENATDLGRQLKSISEMIELKHIQSQQIPLSITEKLEDIQTKIFINKMQKPSSDKTKITISCPLCGKKNDIELPTIAKGVKLIEHQVYEKEICEHSFTVYFDSKFKVLGYKDQEVEMTDMKSLFGKLKSPYD